MAFKMKSGNKVSFKNMGSSPAKQKMEKIPSKKAERLATSKTGRVMQNVLGKSVSKESDTKSTEREQRSKHTSKHYSPLKQGVTSDGVEIKSKKQISQENKTAKTSSRKNKVTEDRKILGVKAGKRKYTKAERKADKMTNLKAKQKRAVGLEEIGKGEKGFSWKEAGKSILRGEGLMGNIASGMGKGRDKSAIVKDKITTVKEKGKRKEMQKDARATRKAERAARLKKNIDISDA